jgi:magnesium chelatase family protein
MATLAQRTGRALLLPAAVAPQAALVPGVRVVAVNTLAEAVAWLRGEIDTPPVPDPEEPLPPLHPVDLADVRGQRLACEALEVAAAGAHHLLMVGPPAAACPRGQAGGARCPTAATGPRPRAPARVRPSSRR